MWVFLPSENLHAIKPAAVIRNRFDTLAHRELYLIVLQRLMENRIGKSAIWARELLITWRVFD